MIEKARTYLDLEKERINQLLTMLADFSTQAALLGGAAISSMGGESLDSLDDEHENHSVGAAIFVSSGALALATSLWVIFISSHLSSLTRDSSMRPQIIDAPKHLARALHSVPPELGAARPARPHAGCDQTRAITIRCPRRPKHPQWFL